MIKEHYLDAQPNSPNLDYKLLCDLNKEELSWLVMILELGFEFG